MLTEYNEKETMDMFFNEGKEEGLELMVTTLKELGISNEDISAKSIEKFNLNSDAPETIIKKLKD